MAKHSKPPVIKSLGCSLQFSYGGENCLSADGWRCSCSVLSLSCAKIDNICIGSGSFSDIFGANNHLV